MGKASRKRKENRIKGMYSMTDPVITKYLDTPMKRYSQLYNEECSDQKTAVKMDTIVDKIQNIFQTKANADDMGKSMSNVVLKNMRASFGRSIQLGDCETIFIDNEKLFTLLATSKVPDIDVRSFIMENNIPHLVIPFKQYVKEYPGFENMLLSVPFIQQFGKTGQAVFNKNHIDVKYLLENCIVHIVSLLFYVPRTCSEYCIKVQLIFMYDETEKQFIFYDYKGADKQEIKLAADIQLNAGNDSIFMEVLLDTPDDDHVKVAVNVFPCNELATRLRETKDGKDLIFGEDTDESSGIMKLVGNLFVNYILYRSTFPEFVVDGLPEHKIVNSNAQRLNIPNEIYESFEDGNISFRECGKKMPHYRRGYFRVLQSDRFKAKRYTTVWIKPTFIHKDKFSSIETLTNKD